MVNLESVVKDVGEMFSIKEVCLTGNQTIFYRSDSGSVSDQLGHVSFLNYFRELTGVSLVGVEGWSGKVTVGVVERDFLCDQNQLTLADFGIEDEESERFSCFDEYLGANPLSGLVYGDFDVVGLENEQIYSWCNKDHRVSTLDDYKNDLDELVEEDIEVGFEADWYVMNTLKSGSRPAQFIRGVFISGSFEKKVPVSAVIKERDSCDFRSEMRKYYNIKLFEHVELSTQVIRGLECPKYAQDAMNASSQVMMPVVYGKCHLPAIKHACEKLGLGYVVLESSESSE